MGKTFAMGLVGGSVIAGCSYGIGSLTFFAAATLINGFLTAGIGLVVGTAIAAVYGTYKAIDFSRKKMIA
jgi:hypothetical protein